MNWLICTFVGLLASMVFYEILPLGSYGPTFFEYNGQKQTLTGHIPNWIHEQRVPGSVWATLSDSSLRSTEFIFLKSSDFDDVMH